MIPLNRPICVYELNGSGNFFQENYAGYNYSLLFASRDCLNLIYKDLYEKYGKLRVLVSPLTCFIALYPIVSNGHIPVFADINPCTLNIDENNIIGRKDVQVLQIIYLGGNPVDLQKIMPWVRENNIILIEDCAQALGSSYNGQMLGTFGDYSVFSMVKNLHATAGGLLLSKYKVDTTCLSVVPKIVMMYKKTKRFLECKTVADRISLYNFLYENLLRLKESNEATRYENMRKFDERDERCIIDMLIFSEFCIEKRLEVANSIIDGIDSSKYFIQQEVSLGKSNRNRLLLVSKNRCAKDIIIDLRKNGIAANNLTQSYINGYQESVKNNEFLSQYYCESLEFYETVFPQLIAIPNSPSLRKNEVNYIVEKVNEMN